MSKGNDMNLEIISAVVTTYHVHWLPVLLCVLHVSVVLRVVLYGLLQSRGQAGGYVPADVRRSRHAGDRMARPWRHLVRKKQLRGRLTAAAVLLVMFTIAGHQLVEVERGGPGASGQVVQRGRGSQR